MRIRHIRFWILNYSNHHFFGFRKFMDLEMPVNAKQPWIGILSIEYWHLHLLEFTSLIISIFIRFLLLLRRVNFASGRSFVFLDILCQKIVDILSLIADLSYAADSINRNIIWCCISMFFLTHSKSFQSPATCWFLS